MSKKESKEERPIAYPKPTETDKQLDNQDEFIQQDKKKDEEQVLKNDNKTDKTQKNSTV